MKKTLLFGALALAQASIPAQAADTWLNAREHRIIGGGAAPTATYPWMVSVKGKDGGHFCGASLIDTQWVLTAAHCVEEESAAGIQVTIAEYDQSKADDGEQTLDVSAIYLHQQYGDDHDIALLKLSTVSDKTPVALADSTFMANLASGAELTTIGWGLTKDGDNSSAATVLQQVNVPLYDQAQCKTNYGTLNIAITDNMVCAGLEAGGKDSCQGDSGGPLFVQSGGSMVQLGITSFGEACAKAKFPGVYTRVAAYSDWIIKAKNGEVPAHQGPKPGGGNGSCDDCNEEAVLGLPPYLDLYLAAGETQATDTLTLTNPATASANLMVSEMTLVGDGFTLSDNGCENQAVEPGKDCRFKVTYKNPASNATYAEGELTLATNHSQHSRIVVELFALNGDAFDEGDGVTCAIFDDLNIRQQGLTLDCEDQPDGDNNSDGSDADGSDEKDPDATITVAGALNPWMLLGLMLLPLAGRRNAQY